MLRLNRSGDYADNPILEGVAFTARLHKHNATEEFLKAWVTTEDDGVVVDLTDRCVVADEEVEVEMLCGTDTVVGFPAVLNVIHFTTTFGHVKGGIFCATKPSAMVLLDGYNADDPDTPAVLRISE
jgi:hypothetical protein